MPITAGTRPAAARIASIRYVTVVFPLVPVTPVTRSFADGSPWNATATPGSTAVVEGTRTTGRGGEGSSRSTRAAAAPPRAAVGEIRVAVGAGAGNGDEQVAGPHGARIDADPSDPDLPQGAVGHGNDPRQEVGQFHRAPLPEAIFIGGSAVNVTEHSVPGTRTAPGSGVCARRLRFRQATA